MHVGERLPLQPGLPPRLDEDEEEVGGPFPAHSEFRTRGVTMAPPRAEPEKEPLDDPFRSKLLQPARLRGWPPKAEEE